MTYVRNDAKKLLTAAELELFDAGRTTEIRNHTKSALRGKLERSRKLRDKYRDLFRRQRVAIRNAIGSSAADRDDANRRTQQKEEIFAESVARFEARLAQLEREEDRTFEKVSKAHAQRTKAAAKKTSGKTASVEKVSTKRATAKKAVAKKAAATKSVATKANAAKSPAKKSAVKKPAAKVKKPATPVGPAKTPAVKKQSSAAAARELVSKSARATGKNSALQTSRGTEIGAHQRAQTKRAQAKKDSR